MTIGEKIRSLRKERKITQKRLAFLSGIAEITIRQYEAGKYTPKLEQLKKIADALNVKLNVLIGNDFTHENPFITPFFAVKDMLGSLGYEVEVYEEDAYMWIRDRNNGDIAYEITQEALDALIQNIASYTKFQVQELLTRSRKLTK